ncbi:MAG: translesion DNA synthesis-associated protein ImuA [Gammaproteobacteria bacterium]
MSLQQLLQQGSIWRGNTHDVYQYEGGVKGIASGYDELDDVLPFHGWPTGALTEILHLFPGQGELQLLLPALGRLTHEQCYVVLINPPWVPCAFALSAAGIRLPFLISISGLNGADQYWAMEQSLRADQCGAVLVWPDQDLNTKTLRRLQLAAEKGESCGFLFRHPRFRKQHSPAALRLQLHAEEVGAQLEMIKCRGRSFVPGPVKISLA